MPAELPIALLGFLLGCRHALDADHVVAVSAIAARTRTPGRLAGIAALWGLGHSLTILFVGGALVTFRIAVPPRLALAAEFAVALMLIALGIATLRRRHLHGDPQAPADDGANPGARPLLVGMVHGLAGSAAVALLVVTTVADPRWALAYLALFGAGTVAGMVGATLLVGAPVLWFTARAETRSHRFTWVAGSASVALGVWIAVELARAGLFWGPVTATVR